MTLRMYSSIKTPICSISDIHPLSPVYQSIRGTFQKKKREDNAIFLEFQEDVTSNISLLLESSDPDMQKQLLLAPIVDLKLDRRICTNLILAGIRTIGDIAPLTRKEMRRIPNIHDTSIKIIRQALIRYGVHLKTENTQRAS